MTVELYSGDVTVSLAGTLFGKEMPRLVSVNHQRLEAYLDGSMLLFHHHDVPGIIGAVGTTFGEHGVNIAQMAVGRDEAGGEAIGVLNLDSEPSAEGNCRCRGAAGCHRGQGGKPSKAG